MGFLFGTFFTISDEMVSTTLNYTKAIISDISPILLPIIAVMLGLVVFSVIVSALRGH